MIEIGAVYRALKIVELPTRSTGVAKQESPQVYLMVETEGRESINVWIASTIYNELKKYDFDWVGK